MLIIIGVVGQIASGKGILVKYLTEKLGFSSFSLSTIVHDELKKKGIKLVTRQALQDIGDELRKREGNDVLARKVMEKIQKQTIDDRRLKIDLPAGRQGIEAGNLKLENQTSNIKLQDLTSNLKHPASFVIEGIRNPAEIEFYKKLPDFVLIGVKAKRELRFKRLLGRAKPWDSKDWNDFLRVDKRDLGIGQNKSGQQVGKCLAYCDYVLTNNKDMKDFERKVERLMKKIIIQD